MFQHTPATRFKFAYGQGQIQTVTVRAANYEAARARACEALDKRYERLDREPPVGWTLTLLEACPVIAKTAPLDPEPSKD